MLDWVSDLIVSNWYVDFRTFYDRALAGKHRAVMQIYSANLQKVVKLVRLSG